MNTLLIFLKVGSLGRLLNPNLNQYLKSNYTWAKLSEDVWIIKTTATAIRVRDDIMRILSASVNNSADQVVVIEITKSNWGSFNLPAEIATWMKSNI
jgi:hypothetical protein